MTADALLRKHGASATRGTWQKRVACTVLDVSGPLKKCRTQRRWHRASVRDVVRATIGRRRAGRARLCVRPQRRDAAHAWERWIKRVNYESNTLHFNYDALTYRLNPTHRNITPTGPKRANVACPMPNPGLA
eukprot:COSAG03_NODE_6_length_26200_cov_62.015517_15_plen_132_part_00